MPRAARVFRARAAFASALDYLRDPEPGPPLSTPHFLVFALALDRGAPTTARFGVTVSRKVGDAVMRNRVKRWIRESCRRWAPVLPPSLDIVVVARPQAARAGFAPISAELASLTKRLR